MATRLNELLDEIAVDNDRRIAAREVTPGHVHIFARVRPTDSPGEVARKFNGRASLVLRGEFVWLAQRRVLRSKSYFAASLGYVSEATIRRHIERQRDAAA